jgi:ABC-type dipeptide/oligopeptide/nickel transport system permease component
MFRYILKRFLIFIPTLFIISLLIFGLSKLAPGDPVELLLKGGTNAGNTGQRADLESGAADYQAKAKQLGLDKPTFYFSFGSVAYPKDLYKINKQIHRENISRLINLYGNSDAAMAYYETIKGMELACADLSTEAEYEMKKKVRDAVDELYFRYDDQDIQNQLKNINEAVNSPSLAAAKPAFEKLQTAYKFMQANPTTHLLYIPTINWYGFGNQYHTWMFGDMPWLSSIDSTPYHQVADFTRQMDKLGKNKDSLLQILKPTCTKYEIYKTDIENPPAGVDVDSLKIMFAVAQADSIKLTTEITGLETQIQGISTQRDAIKKTLQTYTGKGFVRGDFGISYKDNRPVATKMKEALFWTIIMNFLSIFLSYIVSIPLGVQSAIWKKNTLQFFDIVSYPTLIAATLCNGLIAAFTFFGMAKLWFVLGMAGIMTAFIILELFRNAKYIRESDGIKIIWAILYTISIAILLIWLWILVEMALAATVIAIMKFPIITSMIVGSFLAVYFYNKYKQKGKETAQNNVFNDGLGNFKIGKTGFQMRGSLLDNISTTVLFVLYSLPSFWIAMILIVFLTTASYGLSWFPSGGAQTLAMMQSPDKFSLGARFFDILHHLILPVICMTYGSFAFLSRQMRGSMLGVVKQDYIRTATAKGLSEDKIIWKHAFRNSLFPIITMFSSVFPRALSGSIAIELIYNIPGMGALSLDAINGRDWPIVFTVALLAAILTMIGNLVSDVLYSVADPRVTFK